MGTGTIGYGGVEGNRHQKSSCIKQRKRHGWLGSLFLTQSQAARELGRVSAKKCEAYPAYGDLGLGRKGCGTPTSNWVAPLSASCFSQPHVSIGLPKPARTSDKG